MVVSDGNDPQLPRLALDPELLLAELAEVAVPGLPHTNCTGEEAVAEARCWSSLADRSDMANIHLLLGRPSSKS